MTEDNKRLMRILRLRAFVICCFIGLLAVPLAAQQSSPSESEQITPAPVILEGETLIFRVELKAQTPEMRAKNVVQRLEELAEDYTVPADHLRVDDTDVSSDIVADGHLVAIFAAEDGAAEGKSRLALPTETLPKLKSAIEGYRHRHSREQTLRASARPLSQRSPWPF